MVAINFKQNKNKPTFHLVKGCPPDVQDYNNDDVIDNYDYGYYQGLQDQDIGNDMYEDMIQDMIQQGLDYGEIMDHFSEGWMDGWDQGEEDDWQEQLENEIFGDDADPILDPEDLDDLEEPDGY